jgi:hypothetical protein
MSMQPHRRMYDDPFSARSVDELQGGAHTESGLGLTEVQRISVSATLQNGSQSRAQSPLPSKEGRNSRKGSKDNEETKFTTLALRPHHLVCSSRVMYQSHPMLLVVFLVLSFLLFLNL